MYSNLHLLRATAIQYVSVPNPTNFLSQLCRAFGVTDAAELRSGSEAFAEYPVDFVALGQPCIIENFE